MNGVSLLPPVPEDDVRFLFRSAQDAFVIDACEDEIARSEMGLVLLAFLDRCVSRLEIFVAFEALHGLFRQIAVWHRMPQHGHPLAGVAEQFGDSSGRLAFAGARADRANRDRRLRRGEHRLSRGDQLE